MTLKSLLVGASVTALAGAAQAQDLYGTAMIGGSFQATDAEPYGNNIAADADFPGAFDSGDGMVAALGLGYRVNDSFRIEGRLGFHSADFDSTQFGTGARSGAEYTLNGEIKSTTLTLEGFYDLPETAGFRPYVKAGVGVARNSYSARLGGAGVAAFDQFDGTTDGYYDNYADQTETNFSWNVGFGGSYAVSDEMTVFAEYQYVDFGTASTGQDSFTDGFRADAAAHEVMIGLRTSF